MPTTNERIANKIDSKGPSRDWIPHREWLRQQGVLAKVRRQIKEEGYIPPRDLLAPLAPGEMHTELPYPVRRASPTNPAPEEDN